MASVLQTPITQAHKHKPINITMKLLSHKETPRKLKHRRNYRAPFCARINQVLLTRVLIWPAITADSHRRNTRTVWLVSGIWLIRWCHTLLIPLNDRRLGVIGEYRAVPMHLLAVLSFPMTGSSFDRAVDLLSQSLALETQLVVFVSQFLEEKSGI